MENELKTNHKIVFGNSKNMKEILPESVNFVVTSPPYPMIEMWDGQFSYINPEIKEALQNEEGVKAYNLMNEELNKTWIEIDRVLSPGGIVCINIGDATRKIGDSFQLYPNHSRITHYFEKMNYQVLPPIIWRKETNKPTKFMGSGMLPPNAYITLEHEYILIFRKGSNRSFKLKEKQLRRESAYFWEERNIWFSDLWSDLKGISQKLNHRAFKISDFDASNTKCSTDLRERSAAFPFELAYRLINMFSVQGDTILDPFVGTGTTTLAAMCAARNSVGYELESKFKKVIEYRVFDFLKFSRKVINERLENHVQFVEKRKKEKGELKHESLRYGFKVMTGQEKNIFFPTIEKIETVGEDEFEVLYDERANLFKIKKDKAINVQIKLI